MKRNFPFLEILYIANETKGFKDLFSEKAKEAKSKLSFEFD